MGSASPAEIILYTNHACPWAHRAHIALAELGIPFKEEIVDLSVPRTPEYLAINPRGLVPSINYNGQIITESAIVSQFLVDQYPSHLLKRSDEEGGPLQRARINFFVDAYFSKVQNNFYPILKAQGVDKEELLEKLVGAVAKELEPLLQDASPFFGGSSKLTLAEVLTGSFIIRVLTLPKYQGGLLPKSLLTTLETKAPAFWKWANAVILEKSVNGIFNEEKVANNTATRVQKMLAAASQ